MVGIEWSESSGRNQVKRKRGRMEKGCIVIRQHDEQLVKYNEMLEQVWVLVNVACRGNVGIH